PPPAARAPRPRPPPPSPPPPLGAALLRVVLRFAVHPPLPALLRPHRVDGPPRRHGGAALPRGRPRLRHRRPRLPGGRAVPVPRVPAGPVPPGRRTGLPLRQGDDERRLVPRRGPPGGRAPRPGRGRLHR